MTVAELKALLPADTAQVFVDGVELLASDVEVDKDGDFIIYLPDEEEFEDEDKEEEGE